jgi:hypothetical protein
MPNPKPEPSFILDEDNEVMDEVYAIREELSRKCDYDVGKICDYLAERRKELEKEGVRFVTPEESERRRQHDNG